MEQHPSQTQSAKLAEDYWITLTRAEEPDEWVVRVLGPVPHLITISAATEEEARASAASVAAQYFVDNDIDAAVPATLRWSAATKLSFKVPV